ncbi:kelch domain-containing protein 4 [Biomphalaria glabrata]|nr:kelch domain-containing protein 4 [Biomphalaria glabrata]
MGKKNKKEKKGKGKEKTEQKTEKKAEKRSKKELALKGEEDIEKLIAEFQEQDRRKTNVIEEKTAPPSPRCNISLVAHPEKDELLMFGGEYFTGNKMYMYNDLYIYQIKKNEWLKISIPNSPPPRSAHQAVTVSHQGGQMWIFGGEFSSHTQNQFYHYKDLWCLNLKEKKWEQIKAAGGPSARSGHRMVAIKKQIIVFGGFHDNNRDYKYFNDVYSFDLETYKWTVLNPTGNGPSPRSGCLLLPIVEQNKIIICGGYSKDKVKKDVDKGITHSDMFALIQDKKQEDASEASLKWKWQQIKQSGALPSARSGMSAALAPGNKAFLFGGVYDMEEDDEDIESTFFNDLLMLDSEKGKWFTVQLRSNKQTVGEKKKRRRKKKDGTAETEVAGEEDEDDEEDDEMEVAEEGVDKLEIQDPAPVAATAAEESVFTVTYSQPDPLSKKNNDQETGNSTMEVDKLWPSKRMNPSIAIKDGILYMYGGIYEEGDKQVTLNDFYSLDIHKLDEWNVIVAEDRSLQQWHDSDSSSESGNDEAGAAADEQDEDSDESMEITFEDAPDRKDGEHISDYFSRSQDYWVQKAREIYEEEGETLSERRLVRFAKDICEEACDK